MRSAHRQTQQPIRVRNKVVLPRWLTSKQGSDLVPGRAAAPQGSRWQMGTGVLGSLSVSADAGANVIVSEGEWL